MKYSAGSSLGQIPHWLPVPTLSDTRCLPPQIVPEILQRALHTGDGLANRIG